MARGLTSRGETSPPAGKDGSVLSLSLENSMSLETHVLKRTCLINLSLKMNMSLETEIAMRDTSLEIPLSLEMSLCLPYQQPQRMPLNP
jgi:hypothetical protein